MEIKSIYTIESKKHLECKISEKVGKHGKPIHGFGCSDCKCISHLYKVDDFEFLEKMGMKKWVRGSPRLPESEE